MKIYVVGTGGVGGYFGGLIAKAGNDVTFVIRGEHYKAIKKNGLKVSTTDGNFVIENVSVINKISKIKNPDLILLTVKAYDLEVVAQELASVVSPKTIVITFQNGIDNDLRVKKYFKKGKVIPGVAYVISAKTKQGVIEQTGGLKKLILGERSGKNSQLIKEIVQSIKDSGVDITLSENIVANLWSKYIFICAFSGMTAICRRPIGDIMANKLLTSLYERCIKETLEVAKAEGVKLEKDKFEKVMTISKNTAPLSKSSLLVDIENSRKNEIESLNGTLVRLAEKHKIDVPINKFIYGVVKLVSY